MGCDELPTLLCDRLNDFLRRRRARAESAVDRRYVGAAGHAQQFVGLDQPGKRLIRFCCIGGRASGYAPTRPWFGRAIEMAGIAEFPGVRDRRTSVPGRLRLRASRAAAAKLDKIGFTNGSPNVLSSWLSIMKIGRNEPCPCGSGKKYKVCCGAAATEPEAPQMLAWRRLNRVVRDYAPQLLRFIAESYGPDAIPEAWEEFTLWNDEPFDPESPQVTLFYPWLFHAWRPLMGETNVQTRCVHSIPPSQAFLIARGKSIDPLLYRYLSACLDSPFGFFEVVSVDTGQGMRMREIITETSYSVLERSASMTLQPGDTLYGMLVECDGVVLLEACAPIAIPIGLKPKIVEERELLLADEAIEREEFDAKLAAERAANADDGEFEDPLDVSVAAAPDELDPTDPADVEATLDRQSLFRHEFSNRELYWELVLPLLNPAPPQLHNTDGDPLSMQRLIFDIDSPAETFAALTTLATGRSEDEILQDAEYSADGTLQRVEFHWTKPGNSRHKGWQTTMLGRIEINGTQMVVEVNSARRAAEFKRLVSERLGMKAKNRVTEIQSMERLLSEARAEPPRQSSQDERDRAALMAQPEVQVQLRAMMKQHYATWVDEQLPALRGKTPREAVRNKAGKEKVDALIRDIERMGQGVGGYDASVVADLRKTLGL